MSEKILGLTFWTKILPANQIACFFKGAEATLTNTLTKNSNIVFFFAANSTYTSYDHAGKIFSNLYVYCQRKLENKSHNLAYSSSLQPVIVYNFSELECNFPVPFLKLRDRLLMAPLHGFCLFHRER